MRPNRIRQRMESGVPVFGPNLQLDSPWLVEIIGATGFDFVMLDGEHGIAYNNLPTLIMAADASGITPIVRVPSHERGFILPALEAGAGGVQIPMVNTVDEAAQLVVETKYAPLGRRGFSNATRGANYGAVSLSDYAEQANRETLLILQIETVEALEAVDEIASIPGVDMLFFGPGDLSQSMGYFGQQDAAPVREAIARAIRTIGGRTLVSTSVFSEDDVRYWRGHDIQCFLTTSMHTLRRAFEQQHEALHRGLS